MPHLMGHFLQTDHNMDMCKMPGSLLIARLANEFLCLQIFTEPASEYVICILYGNELVCFDFMHEAWTPWVSCGDQAQLISSSARQKPDRHRCELLQL